MCRDLAVGQIHHQYDHDKKLKAIYRIVSVTDGTATCEKLSLDKLEPFGLRVLLPDNPLCRYKSGPLPQLPIPLEE